MERENIFQQPAPTRQQDALEILCSKLGRDHKSVNYAKKVLWNNSLDEDVVAEPGKRVEGLAAKFQVRNLLLK